MIYLYALFLEHAETLTGGGHVPDYVLNAFGKWTGDESERHDAEELFEDYDFPCKIVSSEELTRLILRGEAKYILDYVKSSTDNFVRVYKANGEKNYQEYIPARYNIKSKYIKNIVRRI